jgi:Zn-dependent protease with chaperone function
MFFLIILAVDYLAPCAVLYLLLLKFRRMFEIEADLLAARATSPRDLATSLSKLADYNLVPMKFPKIIGILKGHPSISERIDRLEQMKQTEDRPP